MSASPQIITTTGSAIAIQPDELALWHKYLAEGGKHYTYDCLCAYCVNLRIGFNAWKIKQMPPWCNHIARNSEGVFCYNGMQIEGWHFCPKCGASRPPRTADGK